MAALDILEREPHRPRRLRERARFFRQVARENGLTVGGDEESPVASLIVGDDKLAMMLSHNLLERGIEVQPIVRPAVSATTARLRFFLTANHTEEQIQATVPVVAQELEKLRRGVDCRVAIEPPASRRAGHQLLQFHCRRRGADPEPAGRLAGSARRGGAGVRAHRRQAGFRAQGTIVSVPSIALPGRPEYRLAFGLGGVGQAAAAGFSARHHPHRGARPFGPCRAAVGAGGTTFRRWRPITPATRPISSIIGIWRRLEGLAEAPC